MAIHASPISPKIRHVMHDGSETQQSWIFNLAEPEQPSAFLVEQSPGCVIRPHFHDTSQFQVAVAGSAKLNGHPFEPVSVHYARRQTSYGPIVAEADGFSYLTLRPARDTGPAWIPEDLAKADRHAPRRQVTTPAIDPPDGSARGRTELIGRDDDGLASWILHLGPGGRDAVPADAGSGGRYLIVLRGDLLLSEGAPLDRLGAVWLAPGEPDHPVTAGAEGLDLLVLQFPHYVVAETEARLNQGRGGA